MIIALTGISAAGKSTFASYFMEGRHVVYFDYDAHFNKTLSRDPVANAQLLKKYPQWRKRAGGGLDWSYFREIPDLNAEEIVHSIIAPLVRLKWLNLIANTKAMDVLISFPVYFTGAVAEFDKKIVIDCNDSSWYDRVATRNTNGCDLAVRLDREKRFMEQYHKHGADYLVDNSGSLETLRAAGKLMSQDIRK